MTILSDQQQNASRFRATGRNLRLLNAAVEILKAEQPVTLRQLYYRLVSSGALGNRQAEYKRLGALMTRAREARVIPRTWIVDHVRATLKPSSWSGLADFGETIRQVYRKDFWERQAHHVEIFVEKDAVAGTIQPVTAENDVALRVCRGYASVSFAGEIADEWARIEKPVFAYYCGDFDPSGFDIERDLREKLVRYSGLADEWRGVNTDGWSAIEDHANSDASGGFYWRRLAVREADFQAFDLIPLPVKHRDSRSAGFLQQHGGHCAEVDALPPSELRRRVLEAIDGHIDVDEWNRLMDVEQAEQQSIEHFVAKLDLDRIL